MSRFAQLLVPTGFLTLLPKDIVGMVEAHCFQELYQQRAETELRQYLKVNYKLDLRLMDDDSMTYFLSKMCSSMGLPPPSKNGASKMGDDAFIKDVLKLIAKHGDISYMAGLVADDIASIDPVDYIMEYINTTDVDNVDLDDPTPFMDWTCDDILGNRAYPSIDTTFIWVYLFGEGFKPNHNNIIGFVRDNFYNSLNEEQRKALEINKI